MSTKSIKAPEGAKQKKSFDEIWALPIVKRCVNIVYSLGASVVIIGAMFKILHLPGASAILGVGMITEAVLFALSIFDAPHPDYHWDHVFPALTEKEANPMNYNGVIGGNGGGNGAGLASAKLPEEQAKELAASIKELGETATQLAGISKVAGLTDSYAQSLEQASEAAAAYVAKQQTLGQASEALLASYNGVTEILAGTAENARTLTEKTTELNKNLGMINTEYELQLKGIQGQAAIIETQKKKIEEVTTGFEQLGKSVEVSINNMTAYQEMTSQLAKNVSELNNVYGNMLSAIKA